MARQEGATIAAKTALGKLQPATTTPIEFVIDGIEVELLINGNAFTFAIRLDNEEFFKYVHARVLAVVVSIDGVYFTESGEYLVNLAFGGNPYFDRNPIRENMTFRTPQRERTYVYQLPDNTPKFTDGGYSWSKDVSPVTPFSAWQISLPPTRTNKGLVFENTTVRVCLSFVLEARIKDAPRLRLKAQTDGAPRAAITKEELVTEMYAAGSVLNGWDVVYTMSLEQINSTMAAQYEENQRIHPYGGKIEVETRDHVAGDAYAIMRLGMTYGYPRITFLHNNERQLKVEMVIRSGLLEKCFQIGEGNPICDPPVSIENDTLTAYVPIVMIEGFVKPDKDGAQTWSVVLDFTKGSFTVENIEMSPNQKTSFSEAVKRWFTDNPVTYVINSLDLSKISTLDAMRPNEFRFKTWTTPANVKVLQLYITTGNRPALIYDRANLNNCDEPLPYGYNSSMMISSRLFYEEVLPSSLNKEGWRIKGVAKGGEPTNVKDSWYGEYALGKVRGILDLSPLYDGYQVGSGSNYTFKERWAWLREPGDPPPPRFPPSGGPAAFRYTLEWDISGMTLRPDKDGRMRLNFFHQATQDFMYSGGVFTYYTDSRRIIDYYENPITTEYNIHINSIVPIIIMNSGREQTLHVDIKNVNPDVSGHLSGGGPCNSDNLQAIFNRNLKEQLPDQIKNQLKVSFDPISIFALKNLLFPTKNYIDMEYVAAPGDILLLGNFKKDA